MEEEDADLVVLRRLIAEGRRWLDEEPPEVREVSDRRPAKFYAPPGTCEYCDRRRAASARSMRASRELEPLSRPGKREGRERGGDA
jgi:hypothetical protein